MIQTRPQRFDRSVGRIDARAQPRLGRGEFNDPGLRLPEVGFELLNATDQARDHDRTAERNNNEGRDLLTQIRESR
jgi:hypothetical protein